MQMQFILIVIFVVLAVGVFGFSMSRQRYKEPGSGTDYRNVEQYGEPVKSLYTSTKVFTLHHRIDITDGEGKVAYRAETQFPSIHDKTDIYNANNVHIAHMERKLLTFHEIHYVDMEDGTHFTLSNEIFHIIRDVTNIEGLGWILEGNFLQLNFTIKDADGSLIALVSQKLISLHDKYAVDIYNVKHEEKVVAILVALQHMIADRNAAASSGGASASSSN